MNITVLYTFLVIVSEAPRVEVATLVKVNNCVKGDHFGLRFSFRLTIGHFGVGLLKGVLVLWSGTSDRHNTISIANPNSKPKVREARPGLSIIQFNSI